MASMAGLDELALSLPQTTREVSSDGRPELPRVRQVKELLLDRDALHDVVAEAWLPRAQRRVAKAWLAQQS
jgi:hypothetical protein